MGLTPAEDRKDDLKIRGEMIIAIGCTRDSQGAFSAGGIGDWYPADPVALSTSMQIAVDPVRRRPDDTAPISMIQDVR